MLSEVCVILSEAKNLDKNGVLYKETGISRSLKKEYPAQAGTLWSELVFCLSEKSYLTEREFESI